MLAILRQSRLRLFLTVFSFFVVLFLAQVVLGYFFIRQTVQNQMERRLATLSARIENDLVFQNGVWDTTKYDADPLTPFPTGSSGFATPLYIITSDGYVIDRRNAIPGILDSADFEHALQFVQPTTIGVSRSTNSGAC